MKPKNLKEFKALIERYESITLEEIEEGFKNHPAYDVPAILTGAGDEDSCTLCKNITIDLNNKCPGCVYTVLTNGYCSMGINKKTFDRILWESDTPLKLLNAFRARVKHMKTLLK